MEEINWQTLAVTARRYAALSRVAKECDMQWQHINRLARGETAEPRFNSGLRLLAWAQARFTDEELQQCRAR